MYRSRLYNIFNYLQENVEFDIKSDAEIECNNSIDIYLHSCNLSVRIHSYSEISASESEDDLTEIIPKSSIYEGFQVNKDFFIVINF